MRKELEFECEECWDLERDNFFKFKTDTWRSSVVTDTIGIPSIEIEEVCPKCNSYCYLDIGLDSLLEMVFDLQEEIKKIK